jgi:hypothetical protein
MGGFRRYETKRRREGRIMHKMSKESMSTISSLQQRLKIANKIISVYSSNFDKFLKYSEALCNELDKIERTNDAE